MLRKAMAAAAGRSRNPAFIDLYARSRVAQSFRERRRLSEEGEESLGDGLQSLPQGHDRHLRQLLGRVLAGVDLHRLLFRGVQRRPWYLVKAGLDFRSRHPASL